MVHKPSRGEKGGNSFSFNIEKGLGHDFADPGFDKDLIGLVCLTDGLGEGKEARLEAVRVIAEELKIETPWFARGRRSGPQQSGEASSGWRFQWQAAKSLLDPTVMQHPDLSAPLEYLDGRAIDEATAFSHNSPRRAWWASRSDCSAMRSAASRSIAPVNGEQQRQGYILAVR